MPRIPGVPTLDPVNQPLMSPAEAGKPGQAIAGLGEVANDTAETGLALDLYIKKAQEHVDSLAAQNELAKVYADTQNQLAKTQNSRDVAGVIEQSNKTLNDVAAQWSKSPASVAIQMSADALRPDLTRIGTVRQVDLMGKELNITLTQQAEVLAGNYAADRAAGGSGDLALGAFSTAVAGGVKTGLLGDAEANEYVRQFRQKGQELQIRNGITNANPEVNQKTYDDIAQHRDQFPDVTQEQLDVMKGQALSAFEAHTKQQEWAEGQMAQNTMLRPLIQLHTNPATGQFDIESATTDIAKQFEDGKITATQEKVLTDGVKSYQADLNGSLDKQAGKLQDDIIKQFHDHKYSDAYAALEKERPWLEQNGMSDLYKGLMNYGDSQRRQERAEAREEHTLARQDEQEDSYQTFAQLQLAMSQGHVFTDSQILNLAGHGRGKMLSPMVSEALTMSHSYQKDPTFQAAVNLLANTFPMAKTDDATTLARTSKRQAMTYEAWQQRINENPKEDKVAAMNDVLKPAIQDHIADQINQLFGTPAQPKDSGSWMTRAPGESWTDWWEHRTGGTKDAPKVDATPKDGDTKKNSSGDTVVYRDGRWGPA